MVSNPSGPRLNIKTVLSTYGDFHVKDKTPLGRLIFNMGIAIPGKTVFLIETAPWFFNYFSLYVWVNGIIFFNTFAINWNNIYTSVTLRHIDQRNHRHFVPNWSIKTSLVCKIENIFFGVQFSRIFWFCHVHNILLTAMDQFKMVWSVFKPGIETPQCC